MLGLYQPGSNEETFVHSYTPDWQPKMTDRKKETNPACQNVNGLIGTYFQATHLGPPKLRNCSDGLISRLGLRDRIEQVTSKCLTCKLTNAKPTGGQPGVRLRRDRIGLRWKTDFTEVKQGKYSYRYLIVFVDFFFSG